MKKLIVLGLATLSIGVGGIAYSGTSDNQTVTFEVQAIDEITVSGNPAALVVNSATAGSDPDAVTDATTSYSITTNGTAKKITGVLDSAMPANTTLKVTLTAPTGATSAGQITLTASAQNLVTGIATLAESAINVSYEFAATAAAGIIASSNRTVTLTVADGP